MSRISKVALKNHEDAMALVELERDLKLSEKEFVLANFMEEAVCNIGWSGSFFTGEDLAWEFGLCVTDSPSKFGERERVVDICAGIGMLGFHLLERFDHIDLVCVELNETFVKVGRKVLPSAHWICGSITDKNVIEQLKSMQIQTAISNPPFGSVTSMKSIEGNYTGANAAFKVAEVALQVASRATFILPTNCCPFKYSGQHHYQQVENDAYDLFSKSTGIDFRVSCLDTSLIGKVGKSSFRNTDMVVEVVHLYRNEQWDFLNCSDNQFDLAFAC